MPFTEEEIIEIKKQRPEISAEEILSLEERFDAGQGGAQELPPMGSFVQELTQPGFGGEVIDAAGRMVSGLGEFASSAVQEVAQDPRLVTMGPLGPLAGMAKVATRGVSSPGEAADRLGQVVSSFVPGGQTGYQAAKDYFNDELAPAGAYGRMFRRELAETVAAAPLGAIASIPKAVRGVGQAVRKQGWGFPENVVLERSATRPTIYANTMNVGQGISNVERNLSNLADNYHAEFSKYDPTRGIDLDNIPPGQEVTRWQQFQQNLADDMQEAVSTRNAILGEAEQAGTAGIKITDIPTDVPGPNGTLTGLALIEKTLPDGKAGIAKATNFIEELFGVKRSTTADEFLAGIKEAPEGKALSPRELNEARMTIDAKVKGLGEYDLNQLPQEVREATKAEVAALQHYRAQIDNALKETLATTLGREKALVFDAAGGQYGYATTYANIADRFLQETGQGFTPGSAKRVAPGPQGAQFSGQNITEAVKGLVPFENTLAATAATGREVAALKKLRQLVDINRTPGFTPQTYGFEKTAEAFKQTLDPSMLAGSQALARLGFESDELTPPVISRSWDVVTKDPGQLIELQRQATFLGIIPPNTLGTLSEPLQKEIHKQVAARNPGVMEAIPGNFNVINGKFQSPIEQHYVMQEGLNKPLSEQAKIIGAAHQNKYVPLNSPPAPQARTPIPSSISLSRMNRDLSSVVDDSSFDGGASDMLEQLNSRVLQHEQDAFK